jgi:hypothetical protein
MCWLLVGQYNRRIQGRKMADPKRWYARYLLSAACFYCSGLDAAFRIQCWMRLLAEAGIVGWALMKEVQTKMYVSRQTHRAWIFRCG